jgi:DNA polymerase III delta prime subunit
MGKYYNHDKVIVAEYFKQRIKSFSIEKYSDNEDVKNHRYHLIILLGCDLLSYNAQYAMRRLMETYYKTTRFIFLVKNINKLVQPLQSRCINVHVKTPTNYEVQKILEEISIFKEINILPTKIQDIVNSSNGNLKIAISSLFISETSKDIYIDPEINDITYICKKISSFKKEISIIYEIKDLIYSLLIKGINSNKIINIFYNYFIDFFNKTNKDKIIDLTEIFAYYDSRIVNHCKDVIHFEALIYNLFSLIHNNEYFIDNKC